MTNIKRTPEPCPECLRGGLIRGQLAGRTQQWFEQGERQNWVRAAQARALPYHQSHDEEGLKAASVDFDSWEKVQTPEFDQALKELAELNTWAVCHHGNRKGKYPWSRREGHLSMEVLFGRGRYTMLRQLEYEVSAVITGTPDPSEAGIEAGRRMGNLMAELGVWVIGSLDHPIEREAIHSGLNAGGKAIAFTGNSIDTPEDDRLQKHGLLLSHMPPGTQTYPWATLASQSESLGRGDFTLVMEYEEIPRTYTVVDAALGDSPGLYMNPEFPGCQEAIDRYKGSRTRSVNSLADMDAFMEKVKWKRSWK